MSVNTFTLFILDRPKSDLPTYIFIKTTLKDGPYKASLCVKVLPAHWDRKSKRAAVSGSDRLTNEDNKSINALLSKIDNFVQERTRDARYTGKHLKVSELASMVNELTGKRKRKQTGPSMYAPCRLIIADMRSGKLLTDKGKKFSGGTCKNYDQSLNTIEAYNPDQTFQGVDMEFYRSFVHWCNQKDFSLNYIAQHIKNFRRLLEISNKRELHNNKIYLDEDFAVIQEETDDIALTEQELITIYKKPLVEKTHDLVRDWFIIDCYTGLRVGDIKLLDSKNIKGDQIQIANEKTDTKVVVPMHPFVKAILKKWKGLPPKLSDGEVNRSIKEVCKKCGINGPVLYSITKGGERKDFYLEKWQMVSNHSARRSFITNLLRLDVPDNKVMQLAGIKKHSTLMRYKKTKPEETALDMKGHAFFKGG